MTMPAKRRTDSAMGKRPKILLLFVALFTWSAAASPPEGVTVTATRSPWPRELSPVSQTTVDNPHDDLRRIGYSPGATVTRSGGAGQVTSMSLRGASSEHTLVLWDGIRWNDPLHPGRGADLSLGSGWLARRVEIVRGPHSVVHGSDGLGGVVQIFPWEATSHRQTEVQQGVGSFGTTETRARTGGSSPRDSWQLASSWTKSRGFSAADESEGNTERDGHYRLQNMARVTRKLGTRHEARVSGLYTLAKTDTDSRGGRGGDQTGSHGRSELGAWLAGMESQIGHGVRSEWQFSELRHLRSDNTAGDTRFRSRVRQGSALVHGSRPGLIATAGLDATEEVGNSPELPGRVRVQGLGLFSQVNAAQGIWFGTVGARLDQQDRFGRVTTLRAAPGVWILQDRLRARSSLGTAFKAPSLYQLHSSYGTSTLRPERSQAWDAGLEWTAQDARLDVAAFENRFRELVEYDLATSRYQNTGAARTWGIEAAARSPRWSGTVLDASWTWLRSRRQSDSTELLRRPRHQASLGAEMELDRATWLRVEGLWKGQRWDTHPTLFTRQKMPAWITWGLQARWKFQTNLTLMAELENIFNRKYQDMSGYGTAGRSGMLRLAAEL